jgi:hypothetical protein
MAKIKEIFTEMQNEYGENLEDIPVGMTSSKYLENYVKNIKPPMPPKDREVHISGESRKRK